jgi:hypothetical protein
MRKLPATERLMNEHGRFNRCKCDYSANRMEMTMRLKIITVLIVPLFAALAAQVAAASQPSQTQTKKRAAACERLRNSNAYAAPSAIAIQSDWSNYANGAMASGIAGH